MENTRGIFANSYFFSRPVYSVVNEVLEFLLRLASHRMRIPNEAIKSRSDPCSLGQFWIFGIWFGLPVSDFRFKRLARAYLRKDIGVFMESCTW